MEEHADYCEIGEVFEILIEDNYEEEVFKGIIEVYCSGLQIKY